MASMEARIAARYLERTARKVQVRRKDTGRVVWVSPETLREKAQEYEPLKDEPGKTEKPRKRPAPGSLGEMKEQWQYERQKKKEKKELLSVRPQESPQDAYKEIERVRSEQLHQHKEPPVPSKSDVKYNPDLYSSRKHKTKAEDAVDRELKRVLDKGEDPDPKKLRDALIDLRKVHYPFGGTVAPGGRRLRNMIKMLDQASGKRASDVHAMYEMAQMLMRDLFPGKFEQAKPDIRHEQVRKLLERHQARG